MPSAAHIVRAVALSRSLASQPSRRLISTTTLAAASPTVPESVLQHEPHTHFRITLRRSAIALPARFKATLVSLGIHRRMQTVYHPHNPVTAGKILRVKELVQVENVPASAVRTKTEQRHERKSVRGYAVLGSSLHQQDI